MMELLSQLVRQVRLIASRGRLIRTNDANAVQFVQAELLADEVREMARPQDYGLTCVPLPGAQLISLSLSGQRQQSIVIRCEDGRYRKVGLKPGEVCLYTDEGDFIQLKRGRKIEVNAGAEVDVIAPIIQATASTSATITSGDTQFNLTPAAATLKAAAITLDGPVTCTKTVLVNGILTPAVGMAGAAGAPVSALSGIATSADVVASGKSLKGHDHPYTDDGNPMTTGAPS